MMLFTTVLLLLGLFRPSEQRGPGGMRSMGGMGGMRGGMGGNMFGGRGGGMSMGGNSGSNSFSNMFGGNRRGGQNNGRNGGLCSSYCRNKMENAENDEECMQVTRMLTCRRCDCSNMESQGGSPTGPKQGPSNKRPGPPGKKPYSPPCPEECMPPSDLSMDACYEHITDTADCSKYMTCYHECVNVEDECPSECAVPQGDEKECRMYVDSQYPCYSYKKCYEKCDMCPEECKASSDDVEVCLAAMKEDDACNQHMSCGKKCHNGDMMKQEKDEEYMCSDECITLLKDSDDCEMTLKEESDCQNKECMGLCRFLNQDVLCPAICRPPPHLGSGEQCLLWRQDDPICSAYKDDCNEMCTNRGQGPKRGPPRRGPGNAECPEQCQSSSSDIDQCITDLKENEDCYKYKSCHMDCLSNDPCPSTCDMPQDNRKSCMDYIDSSDECYMYSTCYEVCKDMEEMTNKPMKNKGWGWSMANKRGNSNSMGNKQSYTWGNKQENGGSANMNSLMNLLQQMIKNMQG